MVIVQHALILLMHVRLQAILDLHGCSLQCCTMADSTQDNQFVIARSDVSLYRIMHYTHTYL